MTPALIGVDVGTGSARAAVFDPAGLRLGHARRPIQTAYPAPDFAEQSAADIWRAVCGAVREAVAASGSVAPAGLGFDATCSLAVLDREGRPLPVGDDPERNVILWMDHRAVAQADRINATGHPVLRYVGGRISPEMQTPKLLWLKENRPDAYRRAGLFLDLPDFLTWRATGSQARSLCTTVCKWTYLGHEGRWAPSYFRAIGLGDLAEEGFARIGTSILPLGAAIGGLTSSAAADLGLPAGLSVSSGAIDAHAGGIGLLGAAIDGAGLDAATANSRLALIAGTSSCHMAVSAEPRFVPGVWGPYFSAMVPGLHLAEGGQSATGALLEHVISTHPARHELSETPFDALNTRLEALAMRVPFPAALTQDLHVTPDFHGNRSPLADPTLRGMISGLSLSATADDLALLYLATIQGIASGTRAIVEALNASGYAIDTILACGGDAQNPVFLREHADATGCRLVVTEEPEAVLLGAAVLAAVAAGAHPSIPSAMAAMTRPARIIQPGDALVRRYHDRRQDVQQRLLRLQRECRNLMRDGSRASPLAEADAVAAPAAGR